VRRTGPTSGLLERLDRDPQLPDPFSPVLSLCAHEGRAYAVALRVLCAQLELRDEGLEKLSGHHLAVGQALEERGSPHTLP
jgi:hypothetical protein